MVVCFNGRKKIISRFWTVVLHVVTYFNWKVNSICHAIFTVTVPNLSFFPWITRVVSFCTFVWYICSCDCNIFLLLFSGIFSNHRVFSCRCFLIWILFIDISDVSQLLLFSFIHSPTNYVPFENERSYSLQKILILSLFYHQNCQS